MCKWNRNAATKKSMPLNNNNNVQESGKTCGIWSMKQITQSIFIPGTDEVFTDCEVSYGQAISWFSLPNGKKFAVER